MRLPWLAALTLVACSSAHPPSPSPSAPKSGGDACTGALAEACVERALQLSPAGDPRVVDEALRLFESACEANSARGCAALADAYASGSRRVSGPAPDAVPPAQKACRLGEAKGCTTLTGLAFALARPKSGEPDVPRAVTLYREACAGHDPEACLAMGRFSGDGGLEGLHDPERAAGYFTTACEGGLADGCAALAGATAAGRGVSKDLPAARALATKACEAGSAEGCGTLGVLLEDPAAALVAFERGCELGKAQASAFSCAHAAFARRKDPARSKPLLDRACATAVEGAEPPEPRAGCVLLALLFDAGGGFLTQKDDAIALALYDHACEAGWANAFAARGSYHERRGHAAKAKEDYVRACKLGGAEACEPSRRTDPSRARN